MATGNRKHVAEAVVIAWSRLLSWFWKQRMATIRCCSGQPVAFTKGKRKRSSSMLHIDGCQYLEWNTPCNHPSQCRQNSSKDRDCHFLHPQNSFCPILSIKDIFKWYFPVKFNLTQVKDMPVIIFKDTFDSAV